ncbi:Tyrosine ammonia-lyase [Pseudomonas fluorescens]|uniref:phenylalanine aminomutase (D-beta-phenylalanine forming) n=1 Tax=Pseudomonas fluorescens TaxID=294 RepID=UPI00123F9CF4|nr:phenylalanine aminomutase (D-beta-phenylalanine forming) [Pseudomonas fluorescens]VVP70149.1 Tyrosine ammonia-lyase [Pseudomonas fluorescens]
MFIFEAGAILSPDRLAEIATNNVKISLSDETRSKVESSRRQLEKFVAEGRIIYGVNTSMGGFVNWHVPIEKANLLQMNLIRSVATNVGDYLSESDTKAVMLSRINSLARGNSAISLEVLDVLVDLYNAGIFPCIPKKGSLGTSGDLGPLACIALACTGEWKVKYKGKVLPSKDALALAGIEAARLSYKEGLALINGTSAMTGVACCLIRETKSLLDQYCLISALSFEGLHAIKKPFDPEVHKLKPHLGQLKVAQEIFDYLDSSKMIKQEEDAQKEIQIEQDGSVKPSDSQIEDAYSIRCTPQILGPVVDGLEYVRTIVQNELNSSNDNPLIVSDSNDIFHNGHFHGQYVAMAMDILSIGLTTVSNLANRRIDRFLDKSNSNGLPPFLCSNDPGLRLGLMGGQFMTASLTAENRSLCTPLSIQSLSTTADFQDIVSFGLVAARRAQEILENVKYIISFELICACQAAEIRGVEGLSDSTAVLFNRVREIVPFLNRDSILTEYLERLTREVVGRHQL